MAKNPLITESVRKTIQEIYDKEPGQPAKEIRKKVEAQLRAGNSRSKPGWPGLSAVQKVLAEYRKKESEYGPDPEDRTWSMVSLADYDMPPDALPIVLQVWAYAQEEKRKLLTIRQAKWVARLSHIVKEIAALNHYAYVAALYYYACDLARDERIMKISGVYLADWVSDSALYTLMTKKNLQLDNSFLRSMVESDAAGRFKVKTPLAEAMKKVYEEEKGGKAK